MGGSRQLTLRMLHCTNLLPPPCAVALSIPPSFILSCMFSAWLGQSLPPAGAPTPARCLHPPASRRRPLIWDSVSRVYDAIPEDGLIRCDFEPTPDNSDTGCTHVGRRLWVTGGRNARLCACGMNWWPACLPAWPVSLACQLPLVCLLQALLQSCMIKVPPLSPCSWVTGAGVGAYQLRVGQPPGSIQPLVALEEHLGHSQEEVDVVLVEAKANDPAVPDGKVLARVGGEMNRSVSLCSLWLHRCCTLQACSSSTGAGAAGPLT